MKTISFSGGRGIARALFVLAALGGLYFYRKQGGTFSQLAASGVDRMKQARGLINRVAPPVGQAAESIAAGAQI